MAEKKKSDINFYMAVALIVGTIFGAGILGIPYAVSRSGLGIGLAWLGVLGIAVMLMTLYMVEIVLRTKETKQFVGLAEKYLGTPGKYLMLVSMIIGLGGALIAYLIGIGSTLFKIFGFWSPLTFTLIFFVFAGVLIYLGIHHVGKAELLLAGALVVFTVIVCIILFPQIQINNLSAMNPGSFFVPYGVILLALLGYSAIPEIEILLKKEKPKIAKAAVIASVICVILYAGFTIATVGTFGLGIAEIATLSFSGILNIVGNLIAFLGMATGFLALGTVMKDTFSFDLKFNKQISWILACIAPLIVVLAFSPSFIEVLGISGAYAGGLTGILAALMVIKARKHGNDKTPFVVPGGNIPVFFIMLVFLFGIVYQTLLLTGLL